jgi:hypothetical protein
MGTSRGAVGRVTGHAVNCTRGTVVAIRWARSGRVAGLRSGDDAIVTGCRAIVIAILGATPGATPIAIAALSDDLNTAGDITIGRATGQGLDRTPITVVAARWARFRWIAGLTGLERPITTARCTVAIIIGITPGWATAISVFAPGQFLIAASDVTVGGTTRQRVGGAGVAVIARDRTQCRGIAGLIGGDDPVTTGRRTVDIAAVVTPFRTAIVSVTALDGGVVLAGQIALVGIAHRRIRCTLRTIVAAFGARTHRVAGLSGLNGPVVADRHAHPAIWRNADGCITFGYFF